VDNSAQVKDIDEVNAGAPIICYQVIPYTALLISQRICKKKMCM